MLTRFARGQQQRGRLSLLSQHDDPIILIWLVCAMIKYNVNETKLLIAACYYENKIPC
jgi:hypothetical protein